MNKSNQPNVGQDRIRHLVKTVSDFRMLIIIPTVICTLLALGYAVLKSNSWTARQSLVIRDDLVGKSFKPGRFDSLDSLKSAQETILEIARKPQVIRNALVKLGHPPLMMTGKSNWPSEKVIEYVQGRISIGAPNGAEFGESEVILLSTKASTRERSRKFIELMLAEIDLKIREVRQDKIQSMSEELEQAVNTAQISFEQSAKMLQELDAKFGADLKTLRSLNLQNSGDDSLQKTIIEIRSEQRRQANEVDLAKKQQEMLIKSYEDPAQYLVTSSELLQMQPRLNDLVSGLSKAQLELAKVSGKFTDEHVEVKSGKRAILDIKIQILKEIQASIHALGASIEFGEARIQKLVDAENKFEERLSDLSSSRVEYDKLEQEVAKKSEVLNEARQDLALVQSVGASDVDLLTRVGEPQVATRPDGPGKRAIVGAGMLGGLLIGLGLIMFAVPPYEGDDYADNSTVFQPDRFDSPDQPSLDPLPQSEDSGMDLPLASPAIPSATDYSSQPAAIDTTAPVAQSEPLNALEMLSAQAESALSSKNEQAGENNVDDQAETPVAKPIVTRRKTQTTASADSEFAAAFSKVSAQAERNAPAAKPKNVTRVKSITDLFNQSIANEMPLPTRPESVVPLVDIDTSKLSDEAPPSTDDSHPVAQMTVMDEQSTFIQITKDPSAPKTPEHRDSNTTVDVDIPQTPNIGAELSDSQSADDKPFTEAPLEKQKQQQKSNVRPIDLTKVIEGLTTKKPDVPTNHGQTTFLDLDAGTSKTAFVQNESAPFVDESAPVVDPAPVENGATENTTDDATAHFPNDESPGIESVLDSTQEVIPHIEQDDVNEGEPTAESDDLPNRLRRRQSAVTEELLIKPIYTSLDQPDLALMHEQLNVNPAGETTDESTLEESSDPASTDLSVAKKSDSATANSNDESFVDESDDNLSAAEIVRQLRANQQKAAEESSAEAIANVPNEAAPASNADQPDVEIRANDQGEDANVLDIKRREDSTDDASQPISGSAAIPDQLKQLNESISKFCAPLKKNKENED